MDDEINLLEYLDIISKRKWLIISLVLVFAFFSFVFSLGKPKMYEATATILLVDNSGGGLASALSVFSIAGISGGKDDSKLLLILKSRALAEQLAARLDFSEIIKDNLSNSLKKLDVSEQQSILTSHLQSSVKGQQTSNGAILISVVWPEPEMAAKLANLYVEELGKFFNKRSFNINFQMIDSALAPSGPINTSQRKQAILVGAIWGGILGIVGAFILESLGKVRSA